MKIEALYSQGNQPPSGGGNLIIQADLDFPKTLTLGQVIKARVLRSYEGNRYLLDFGGHERIADSSIPLKIGEIVHGRVVGLGEKVELRRVQIDQPDPGVVAQEQGNSAEPRTRADRADHWSRLLQDIFQRYQVRVQSAEADLLRSMLAGAADPDQLVLAAVILAKLGLRLNEEMLRAVMRTLMQAPPQPLFPPGRMALQLGIATAPEPQAEGAAVDRVNELAGALQSIVMRVPDPASERAHGPAAQERAGAGGDSAPGDRHEDSRGSQAEQWSRRILNSQTGGAIAHRVNTVPLLINGRLVELDVALFEQQDSGGHAPQGLVHRQILFSLTTEVLGTIEVKATLSADHLRAEFTAASSERTFHLSRHSAELSAQLAGLGWHVDELRYSTADATPEGQPGAVMRAVAEHIINPGSVRRWI